MLVFSLKGSLLSVDISFSDYRITSYTSKNRFLQDLLFRFTVGGSGEYTAVELLLDRAWMYRT